MHKQRKILYGFLVLAGVVLLWFCWLALFHRDILRLAPRAGRPITREELVWWMEVYTHTPVQQRIESLTGVFQVVSSGAMAVAYLLLLEGDFPRIGKKAHCTAWGGFVLLSLFLYGLRSLPAHDALYLSMFPQVAMALFLLYVTLRTLSLCRRT